MKKNYDVIIIGSGVAGLYAALNLDSNLNVLVLSKKQLILSNTALAQGGVAAVVDTIHDTTDAHLNDTLIAGGFKNNLNSVKVLVSQGPDDVKKIMDYGVDFDRKPDGDIHYTLEGGHSMPRILHHKDSTGREIAEKLILCVKEKENIDVMENATVCDIKKSSNFTLHILKDGENIFVNSHFCILATGGIGRVYEYTTNSEIATGDGITFADKLGAKIKNISFIQFHPTGFANKKTRETFLISESVRGEGAYLLNANGERFMDKYDERRELAPRDVVSKFLMQEAKAINSKDFFLDITHENAEEVKARFPMIYRNLMAQGIDMTKDKIPVYPCQHYLMGGIDVDLNAQTNVNRLYAAGECAHTGVHGKNRLASNSLLEALVFSRHAAMDINKRMMEKDYHEEFSTSQFENVENKEILPTGIKTTVREIMQQSYFVIPNKADALAGYEEIVKLKNQLEKGNYKVDENFVMTRSLVTIAYLILKEVI